MDTLSRYDVEEFRISKRCEPIAEKIRAKEREGVPASERSVVDLINQLVRCEKGMSNERQPIGDAANRCATGTEKQKLGCLKKKGVFSKLEIYDNGGETIDRYTIRIDDDIYSMGSDPFSPLGFNQYAGQVQTHRYYKQGKNKSFDEVPGVIQKAIVRRIAPYKED